MLENKQTSYPRKTVIVLDRTAKFLAQTKQHIDLDSGGKRSSGKKGSSGGLVYKSLWTCCVEAAVEYSRILYDLFPSRHLVSMASRVGQQRQHCTTHNNQTAIYLLYSNQSTGRAVPGLYWLLYSRYMTA